MLETTVSKAAATIENQPDTLVVVPENIATLHRVQLQSFLEKLKGRFVGVDFIKQDGSRRKLNGRLGVHTLQKGGKNTVVADGRPYITVFDIQQHEYRTLNLATVSGLRADRVAYNIVG